MSNAFGTCDRRGPLFGPNRIKLGLFGINVSSAGGLTAAKDRHEIDWKQNVRLVRQAERAGFEAAVPFARWRGFEGATNPWGQSFETYTWAAGIAAATKETAVFCTSHVLTVSPIMAAKQMSTIDHISDGRAVLNVVSGWFKKELEMFGVGELDHDERYAYAEEWLEVLLRLWTQQETFDFEGRYIKVKDGYQQPKSIQSPRPPIMNAAFSPVGHQFAARWADIAFVSPDANNASSAKDKVSSLRSLASEHGRELQVWTAASVVCARTEAEALAEVERYTVSEADAAARSNQNEWVRGGSKMPEARQKMRAAGHGLAGYPLIGAPQQIADEIIALSQAGIDGLCLSWVNFDHGVPQFIDQVVPLLERAGVRRRTA